MIEYNTTPQESLVTPKNVVLKVITSPKKAFLFITSYKYNNHVTFFLILSGITKTFDKAISKHMGDDIPLWGVIAYSILIGISFGWLLNFIYAFAVSWTGRWLNGKGDTQSILRVIAYALLPSFCSLFLILLQIILYGNTIFQSNFNNLHTGLFDTVTYYTFYIIDLALVLWAFILLIIGVSVVQKISLGKAFLNVLLPAFLIVLFALGLYFILDLFFHKI